MSIIYSLEPLTRGQIKTIKSGTGFDVKILDRKDLPSKKICNQIEYLICRDRDNVSELLDKCPQIHFIYVVSVGVEKLPFAKLIEKNVYVCNAKGVNSRIMAQYICGYIIADGIRLWENLENQKEHFWKKYQCVDDLLGKNLLIIGAGSVGRLVAKEMKSFGLNIYGVKSHKEQLDYFDEIISLDSLNDYLVNSDYVVCTIPLTEKTRHLFEMSRFKKMKRTAMFINISRGGIVVHEDLTLALKKQIIGKAVLDVFDKEPLYPDDSLWDVPNLFITPHSSGRLEDFMDKAISVCSDCLKAYQNGVEINKVNLEDGY